MDGRQWRSIIEGAQAGDRRALDELVAGWLPLVYNIVGRALNGHADVDDVVQETMLRAVDHLGCCATRTASGPGWSPSRCGRYGSARAAGRPSRWPTAPVNRPPISPN